MKIFSRIKKHPVLTGVIIGVILLVASFGVMMRPTKAFMTGLPFGGMIVLPYWCPCSFNIAFTVVGQKGGWFTYDPGLSTLFQWWSLRPGAWILGTYWPGTGVCGYAVASPPWCVYVPTMGTVVMAGTSL